MTTDIGIFYFATEYGMPVVDAAREIEDRGFESLWVPEHTHIPTSRKSPYMRGDELPKEYVHTLDPFVALTAAAAVTENLCLGTAISLIIEHDTLAVAKTVATLDLISNGRFEFGLGGGWNREEAENHGVDWDTRFKRLEEQIRACKTIWTEDEAEFHGKYVDFDPVWSWPKPVQAGGPPVLVGGETVHTLRRVARYADGWLPRAVQPEKVFAGIEQLKQVADEEGRNFDDLTISVFAPPPEPELIERFLDHKPKRIVFWLPPEERELSIGRLDRYSGFLQTAKDRG